MKVLHFTLYKDVFGSVKYQTADELTAGVVADYLQDGFSHLTRSYIINRRDIEALEKRGHVIRIK